MNQKEQIEEWIEGFEYIPMPMPGDVESGQTIDNIQQYLDEAPESVKRQAANVPPGAVAYLCAKGLLIQATLDWSADGCLVE